MLSIMHNALVCLVLVNSSEAVGGCGEYNIRYKL